MIITFTRGMALCAALVAFALPALAQEPADAGFGQR
jgi:hypothetical protein